MPIHDFRCNQCLFYWEDFWHISEHEKKSKEVADKLYKCPNCGSTDITKFINAPSIVFKGVPGNSGFYDLDYPNQKALKSTTKPISEEKDEEDKSLKEKIKNIYDKKLNKNKEDK